MASAWPVLRRRVPGGPWTKACKETENKKPRLNGVIHPYLGFLVLAWASQRST